MAKTKPAEVLPPIVSVVVMADGCPFTWQRIGSVLEIRFGQHRGSDGTAVKPLSRAESITIPVEQI